MFILIFYNNSINFITGFVFNELIYRLKVNDILILLENLLAEDYDKLREIKKKPLKILSLSFPYALKLDVIKSILLLFPLLITTFI